MPVVDFDLCPGIYTKQMCLCVCVCVHACAHAHGVAQTWQISILIVAHYNYTRLRRPRASFLKVSVLCVEHGLPSRLRRLSVRVFERKNKHEDA